MGRLKYLLDTNVWLELLLEQEKAETVRRFLSAVDPESLAISEFSVYSICIILSKLKKDELLLDFLTDTLEYSGVADLRLTTQDIGRVIQVLRQSNLDFDDAYQYVAAEVNDLTLVSFDADFDRTVRGRKTPAEVA